MCIKDNQQELKEIFEELSDSADSKKYAEIQTCNDDEVDMPTDIKI